MGQNDRHAPVKRCDSDLIFEGFTRTCAERGSR
jgi:hypothetical protein